MCCFSSPVENVSNTSIFTRLEQREQLVVYEKTRRIVSGFEPCHRLEIHGSRKNEDIYAAAPASERSES